MPLDVSMRQRHGLDETHRHALWMGPDRATLNRGRTAAELLPGHRRPRRFRHGRRPSACRPAVAVPHDRGARAASSAWPVPPSRPRRARSPTPGPSWSDPHGRCCGTSRRRGTSCRRPRAAPRAGGPGHHAFSRDRAAHDDDDAVRRPVPGHVAARRRGLHPRRGRETVHAAERPRSGCSVPPGTRTPPTSRSCTSRTSPWSSSRRPATTWSRHRRSRRSKLQRPTAHRLPARQPDAPARRRACSPPAPRSTSLPRSTTAPPSCRSCSPASATP